MSLPSFSCNLPWHSQILAGVLKFYLISVYSGWSWVLCLGWRTWERSELQEIGLKVSHV